MTDIQITEIYNLAEKALLAGQPFFRVHAFPFPLRDESLNQYQQSPWYDFWRMMQPGFLYFEKYHQPPDIVVEDGRYTLSASNLPLDQ